MRRRCHFLFIQHSPEILGSLFFFNLSSSRNIRSSEGVAKMAHRVETHCIKRGHHLFTYCTDACLKSKNLYNYANYLIRQQFLYLETFLRKAFPDAAWIARGDTRWALHPARITTT